MEQIRPHFLLISIVSSTFLDKNSKELFIKKLQLCMKTYDYKDETKDVKGKVSLFILNQNIFVKNERLNAVNELQVMLQD